MLDFVKVVRRPQNLKKHPNCFNVFSVISKQVGYFVAFSENLIFRQPQESSLSYAKIFSDQIRQGYSAPSSFHAEKKRGKSQK
jgi:hypothetical protein